MNRTEKQIKKQTQNMTLALLWKN